MTTPELCHCIYRNQGYVYVVDEETRCGACEPENRLPFTPENVNRAFEEQRSMSVRMISPEHAAIETELMFLMMPWLGSPAVMKGEGKSHG